MIYDLAGFYLFFAISSSTSCARFFSSHSFLHHHFSATLFACYLLQTLCYSTVCVWLYCTIFRLFGVFCIRAILLAGLISAWLLLFFFWCAQRWLDVVCTFSFVLSLYFGAEIPYLRECEIQRFEMRDNSAITHSINVLHMWVSFFKNNSQFSFDWTQHQLYSGI